MGTAKQIAVKFLLIIFELQRIVFLKIVKAHYTTRYTTTFTIHILFDACFFISVIKQWTNIESSSNSTTQHVKYRKMNVKNRINLN